MVFGCESSETSTTRRGPGLFQLCLSDLGQGIQQWLMRSSTHFLRFMYISYYFVEARPISASKGQQHSS
jgi:TM2 domain-containing membrane protein YozV